MSKGEDASLGLTSCGATEEVHQFGKYALGCCSSAAKRKGTDLLGRPCCGQCCSQGCLSPLLLPGVHKQIRIRVSHDKHTLAEKESPYTAAIKAVFAQVEHALLKVKQVMTLPALRD